LVTQDAIKHENLKKKLLESNEVKLDPNDATRCHECLMGKSTKARMGIGSDERAQAPLDLVHIDLVTDISGRSEYHHAGSGRLFLRLYSRQAVSNEGSLC
jgi:hypothetical protein